MKTEFLINLMEIIEDNLDNPDFTTEALCQQAFLSRSQLHRRLKTLTGFCATSFIRNIRLEKAKDLLGDSSKNVSQIGLECGFSNLSWFAKCFKER